MNILLLNHYAGSIGLGMEFRPYSFAREWVKAGHSVCIVAASFSHLRQKQPVVTRKVTLEDIEGIRYCWIKTPAYYGNSILRAVNIFIFLFRLLLHRRRILLGFTPDIVIGSSTYPLDNYIVHAIAKRFHARHIYEVHDLWPLSLIDLGGMSPHHPFVMLMAWAERYAYKTADTVISLLPNAESHMLARGLRRNKFYCVPNGIDISETEQDHAELPWQHATLLGDLRNQHRFIVGYAGSHAVSNALENIIDAAALMRGTDAAFVLVGSGAEKERLVTRARSLGLKNVYFLPPVPRSSVQSLLARMDVLYLGWQDKPIYKYGVSPNKLLDYLLSSKPIIHSNNAANDVVAECGCGFSVEAEDPGAIADAIKACMKMDDVARASMGMKGKKYLVEHFQTKDLARRYIELCAFSERAPS